MEYSLKRDEQVKLYLISLLPISEICDEIIVMKNNMEQEETLEYHKNRWNRIAGEHYYTRDNHYKNFSYILHSASLPIKDEGATLRVTHKEYIIKPDHRMNFYHMTGISYQVMELIYELIRIRNDKSWDMEIENKIDWVKHDDKLYSALSTKIMDLMKTI